MALRISQKCEQQGVFLTLFCILAAWARTELAMLLEKGYTPATWVVPRMSHNSPNYLWCVSVSGLVRIEAWAHTELTMLLKYINSPVLSVPLTFLSHWR